MHYTFKFYVSSGDLNSGPHVCDKHIYTPSHLPSSLTCILKDEEVRRVNAKLVCAGQVVEGTQARKLPLGQEEHWGGGGYKKIRCRI